MFALDFLSGVYLGSNLVQYAQFFITVIGFALLGKAVYYFLKTYGRRITAKTKSELDDVLLDMVEEPLVMFLVIIGLVIGYQFLTVDSPFLNSAFYNIIGVLVIIVGAWLAVRLADALIKHFLIPFTQKTESKLDDQLVPILRKLSKASIMLLAGIMIISNFGYDVTALLAGLGIGGLAVAFAAQETISNFFGGISIFASKPFKIGDWVEFDGRIGQIKEVGLRTTRVLDLDDRIVTLPNSKISSAIVTNISSVPARKMRVHLGITYGTPVKKMRLAEKLLTEAVGKTKGCRKNPDIYFSEFKDFSLDIFLIYYIEDLDNWMRVKSNVNFAIKEAFDKNKIDFAFPTQTIYMAK
ncbi:MAG: mechanosensitive ion channel family protein [Candidatus Diapherotrites archaeon]